MRELKDGAIPPWIRDRSREKGWAGWNPGGWKASVWILHSMYETDALPSDVTYDDQHRAEPPEEDEVDELLAGVLDETAVLTGTPLGHTEHPGEGWQRLRWRELGERLGVDPFDSEYPPCFRSFPIQSWPLNIRPPGEGSLDREQFDRLGELLSQANPEGWEAECVAHYGFLATGHQDPRSFAGTLHELGGLYEHPEFDGTPNNLWPVDRSWFVLTDMDLWATKVSGRHPFIELLKADDVLETVELPF